MHSQLYKTTQWVSGSAFQVLLSQNPWITCHVCSLLSVSLYRVLVSLHLCCLLEIVGPMLFCTQLAAALIKVFICP